MNILPRLSEYMGGDYEKMINTAAFLVESLVIGFFCIVDKGAFR